MNKYFKLGVIFVCLLGVIFLTYMVVMGRSIFIDNYVYDFIKDNVISDNRTGFMKFITNFASPIFIIVLAVLLVIFIRDKYIKISIIANLLGVTIISNVFKVIVARDRPDVNRLVFEDGYSFPSGHSITSVVFYGYLIYLIFKYVDSRKIKAFLILVLLLLIPFIGFSRVYLGVHYASDVLCGLLLGIVYLIVFVFMIERIRK